MPTESSSDSHVSLALRCQPIRWLQILQASVDFLLLHPLPSQWGWEHKAPRKPIYQVGIQKDGKSPETKYINQRTENQFVQDFAGLR